MSSYKYFFQVIIMLFVFTLCAKAQSEFSTNIIQLGVVVSDIEKSMDFYTNVIGMKKTGEFDIDEKFSKTSGLANGLPFHVDILKLENDPFGTQWKLLSFGKDSKNPKSRHIQDDTGIQYITIRVTSLQAFLERIKARNIPLLGETPIPCCGDGSHFVLIQDPDGTFIELIGPLN